MISASEQILALLGEAAIAASGDSNELDLALPDGTRLRVQVRRGQSPGAARIAADVSSAAPNRRVLYVLEHAAPTAISAAEASLVDLIAIDRRRVVIDGKDYLNRQTIEHSHSARTGWSRWAIERLRIISPNTTKQVDIARALGVSQQAVAKALKTMPDGPMTVAQWRSEYPGADGLKSYWYHLEPISAQGALALSAQRDLGLPGLLSGDLAADEYEPWRLPVQAHIYSPELVDLSPWGFVPASQPEATLTLQVPADRTIWFTAKWVSPGKNLVDPLIALWDLARSPGPDAGEAADRLADSITEGASNA